MSRLLLIVFFVILSSESLYPQFLPIASNFGEISDLDATNNNLIYVADKRYNRVIRIDFNGIRIDSIGGTGAGMYQFDGIMGLDASNGMKLFVADRYNQRVQIFDRRLQYLTSLNRTEARAGNMIFEPIAIAVDRMDQAYFFDDITKSVFKFNFRGEFDKQIFTNQKEDVVENVMLKINENNLYCLYDNSKDLFIYTIDGKYLRFIRMERDINDFFPTSTGFIVVSDSSMSVVDRVGKFVKTIPLPSSSEKGSMAINTTYIFYSDSRTIFRLPVSEWQ